MSEYEEMPKEAREVMERAYTAKKRYKLILEEWYDLGDGDCLKEKPITIESVSLRLEGEDKEELLTMMCEKLMAFALRTTSFGRFIKRSKQ